MFAITFANIRCRFVWYAVVLRKKEKKKGRSIIQIECLITGYIEHIGYNIS